MRAKTINENINYFLLPKSKKDIDNELAKLTPQEIVDLGNRNINIELIKKGIERGGELSYNDFEDFAEFEGYEDFCKYVIEKLIEKGNLEKAFNHSIFMNWQEGMKKCLDILSEDFFKRKISNNQFTKAHATLRFAMNRKVDFETLKFLYNHPKINPFINHKNVLVISLQQRYNRIDLLDKILKE